MTTPAKQKTESVLSLAYRGALPEILRQIADELDKGNATAEHFTAHVAQEKFELSATIDLSRR